MKKLFLLLGIITALFFIFTSCEKEDIKVNTDDQIIIDDQIEAYITVDDLLGEWEFVSLEFLGKTYSDCDPVLNVDYDMITLDLEFVSTNMYWEIVGHLTFCDDYGNDLTRNTYEYKISEDYILSIDSRIFEILEPELFDNTILKLKLLETSQINTPDGGIYTLQRK